MSHQLTFQSHTFSVMNVCNQIWLSSKDIAIALGYSKTNAITKIYNQNTDEFTSGMTTLFEVPVLGSTANLKARTRFFSLRGAHLIAMFARTEVAKLFRRWVLDILDKEVGNQPQPKPEVMTTEGRVLTTYRNGKATSRALSDNEHVATLQAFLEIAQKAQWLVIDGDRLNEISCGTSNRTQVAF